MKLQELLENILKGSENLGSYPLAELLSVTRSRKSTGLAVASDKSRGVYLAFLDGEPEGAIYIDEKGVLFGDKAVLMISGRETFVLTGVNADIVDALIMSSRIFDKNRLKKSVPSSLPEIGRGGEGMGVLSVTVLSNGAAANGIRVSIRKEGRVVGSDITTNEGNVSFRIAFGDYECVLQDRALLVTKHRILFDATHPAVQITL